jgi:hypothetical protein
MKNAYYADYLFYNSDVKRKVWLLAEDGVIAGYSEDEPPNGFERTVYQRSGIFPSFVSAFFDGLDATPDKAAAAGIGTVHLPGVSADLFQKYLRRGFRVSYVPPFAQNTESYLEMCGRLINEYKGNPKVRIAAALPLNPSADDTERFLRFNENTGALLCAPGDTVINNALHYRLPSAAPASLLTFVHRTGTLTRESVSGKIWEDPYRITLGGTNPFRELRTLAMIYKGVNTDSTILSANEAFLAATLNGARALGFNSGELRIGYPADFMAVDFNAPHMQPVYDPISHLVYSAERADVKALFSAGVKI